MRKLRHVTIPDHHDRVPQMSDAGLIQIIAAHTETLQSAIIALASKTLLSDDEWGIWYAIEDELRNREEWSDDLATVGRRT